MTRYEYMFASFTWSDLTELNHLGQIGWKVVYVNTSEGLMLMEREWPAVAIAQ
jgi:hypothetical protein